jgi:LCP family protein required for cell wall assembly
MPENRPSDSGDQKMRPELPPLPLKSNGSQYRRFVAEQRQTHASSQPAQPLTPPQRRTPPPGSQVRGPTTPMLVSQPKPVRRRRLSGRTRVVLIVFGIFVLLFGGMCSYLYFTFSSSLSQIIGQQASCSGGLAGNADPGRINLLLLGSDTDQKFQGQPLAQTDIVVTIDQTTKTVGMLSIPRDFFLNVPGYGMHKLDEAYSLGGVTLSCLTIEQDFGIPLNYYAWVGLDGFINVINTVGGADVNVTHTIVDDNYPNDINNKTDPYALERLYLAPGPQHLNGQQALEYVRSRHADLVGDFGRSARQQQVLLSLKSKLNNPSIFSKLSTIAKELQGSVKTDMQLTDVLKLMNFAKSLNTSAIQRLVLAPPYSTPGTAPADSGVDAGASVVFPNCSAITPALQKLFQQSIPTICNVEGNPGTSWQTTARNNTASAPTNPSSSLATSLTGSSDKSAKFENMGGHAAMSLLAGPGNLFGWHSLLDLMFLVVFESPDALQV